MENWASEHFFGVIAIGLELVWWGVPLNPKVQNLAFKGQPKGKQTDSLPELDFSLESFSGVGSCGKEEVWILGQPTQEVGFGAGT